MQECLQLMSTRDYKVHFHSWSCKWIICKRITEDTYLKCWCAINLSYNVFAHVTIACLSKYWRVRVHTSVIAGHSLAGLNLSTNTRNMNWVMNFNLSNSLSNNYLIKYWNYKVCSFYYSRVIFWKRNGRGANKG